MDEAPSPQGVVRRKLKLRERGDEGGHRSILRGGGAQGFPKQACIAPSCPAGLAVFHPWEEEGVKVGATSEHTLSWGSGRGPRTKCPSPGLMSRGRGERRWPARAGRELSHCHLPRRVLALCTRTARSEFFRKIPGQKNNMANSQELKQEQRTCGILSVGRALQSYK